jgi:hypothetical protein
MKALLPLAYFVGAMMVFINVLLMQRMARAWLAMRRDDQRAASATSPELTRILPAGTAG